jgi:uncharacterized phage protein gp47/JayE
MPFARPPLTALRNQAIQDITTSGVPGLDGLLRNSVLRVLAWVMSGLAYSVYGYIDWISREAVPFTATDEFLHAWAALVGIYQKDSSPATGRARFTGTAGVLLPSGSALTRQDGVPYTTTADATTDVTGALTVPIVAAVNGAATNADSGVAISLDPPPIGLNAGGQITSPGCTGGSDQETEDELRTRMLYRYAQPPQGGAESDYVEWATEVPGCTRAWVDGSGMGPGTVVVYPMFDLANAAEGGLPQGTNGCATDEWRGPTAAGDQLTVADHIYPLRPVTALVYVLAPVPLPIDVALQSLDPGDTDTRARIVASLDDMFLNLAVVGGTIYPSQLYAAIIGTEGVNHFDIVSPAAPVIAAAGHLPVMGALTVT